MYPGLTHDEQEEVIAAVRRSIEVRVDPATARRNGSAPTAAVGAAAGAAERVTR
jgi:hypothetical protein